MSAPLTAVINLDVEGPVISRHIYGHFAEHLGRCIYDGFYVGEDSDVPHEGGIRLDVVEALRAISIPNLRWPGGCFADEYHWMDGIGPREDRPRMVNTHWGDVEENNHFGTHEFMALCELLGADPYISGNVGSGTVREMSEWVEYLTREGDSPMARLRRENGRDRPWTVPFFGLGNEAWGCGGNMSAHHYADEARRYATYLRNHGGNTLYRIAAGANGDDYAWTEALMKAVSHLGCAQIPTPVFQAVSLHYYTMSGDWADKGEATIFSTDEYYTTMVRAQRIESLIAGHSAVMDCYDPTGEMGLVVDEWGTWWNVMPGTEPGFLHQQNALRDALVASLHFDIFHAHSRRVVMANIAQTVNVLQAMLLTDGAELALTPTYHVFEMNQGHQDAASLQVHLLGRDRTLTLADGELRRVSASASVKDGRALVSATNLHATEPTVLDLDLRGRAVRSVTGRLLASDAVEAHNVPGQQPQVLPRGVELRLRDGQVRLELPPHSFATVSLELG